MSPSELHAVPDALSGQGVRVKVTCGSWQAPHVRTPFEQVQELVPTVWQVVVQSEEQASPSVQI
jgi:hypothetical protein